MSIYKEDNPTHNEKVRMILYHCYLILIFIYMPKSFWKEVPKIQDVIKNIFTLKLNTFPNFVAKEIFDKLKKEKFDLIKPEESTCDSFFNIIQFLNNLINYTKEDINNDKILLYQYLEDSIEMIITVISTNSSSSLLLYYIPFILNCFDADELPIYLYPYYITYSRPFGVNTAILLKLNGLKQFYSCIYFISLFLCLFIIFHFFICFFFFFYSQFINFKAIYQSLYLIKQQHTSQTTIRTQ